jgi:hypothetical protein
MDVQDSTRSLEDPNQYLEGFPWYNHTIEFVVQLEEFKWSRTEFCRLCNQPETSDHIIFSAPLQISTRFP